MKILHYSLGFPPYRTGGLTKFCMDLMKQQVENGHVVSLLWPGEMRILNTNTKVLYRGDVNRINSYEVINPTPISYDEGIKAVKLFQDEGSKTCYKVFLEKNKPDVIHIHTLMGLHKSFLVAAKEQGIRIVFSAHDFFPICPKVTMFCNGNMCENVSTCENCGGCNQTALATWKIVILQSSFYRMLKDSWIVKKFRKAHRDNYLSENKSISITQDDDFKTRSGEYLELRNFYNELLSYMDVIHFNSSITEREYRKYMNIKNSVNIPITHADIIDKRRKKEFSRNIRLTYLGPQGSAKGYYWLKAALDELWLERKDFCLNVFFQPVEKAPYIQEHEPYSHDQLEEIFDNTDVLVAPSKWYETFGYTVLEALSFGVPLIVSDNVGAKDILPNGSAVVVEDFSVEGLKMTINSLSKEKLCVMNKKIIQDAKIVTLKEFSLQIENECYKK